MLKLHNDYRAKVAAGNQQGKGGTLPAGTIPALTWDDNLAEGAQA